MFACFRVVINLLCDPWQLHVSRCRAVHGAGELEIGNENWTEIIARLVNKYVYKRTITDVRIFTNAASNTDNEHELHTF